MKLNWPYAIVSWIIGGVGISMIPDWHVSAAIALILISNNLWNRGHP